jgi:PAS domain S-box-containing protein
MSDGTEQLDIAAVPNLLLVEDNPLHVRLVRTMINDVWPGYENLDHVARLDLAVRRVAEHRPDCVLLDLVLPDADGLEAVRAMLAVAPTVPIVVLSAHDDEATAAQAVREGAQDYLVKGNVSAERLSRAVRFAIERHRSASGKRAVDLAASSRETAHAVLDVNGTVIVGNPAMAAMLRRGLDEVVGASLSSLSHAEDLEAWDEALASGSTDAPTMMIARFLRGDGTEMRCRVELSGLADGSGDVAAFIARYQPITEGIAVHDRSAVAVSV